MAGDASRVLLARWCEGDQRSGDELYERFGARLVHLVRSQLSRKLAARFDAEDVVQSACRSFFARAREGQYTIKESGDLWRLLARIVLFKLYGYVDHHTAGVRGIGREQAGAAEAVGPEPDPAEVTALADEAEHFLAGLDARHRQVLEAWLLGATAGEIAHDLQLTERRVRQLRQEAIEQLRKRQPDHDP